MKINGIDFVCGNLVTGDSPLEIYVVSEMTDQPKSYGRQVTITLSQLTPPKRCDGCRHYHKIEGLGICVFKIADTLHVCMTGAGDNCYKWESK